MSAVVRGQIRAAGPSIRVQTPGCNEARGQLRCCSACPIPPPRLGCSIPIRSQSDLFLICADDLRRPSLPAVAARASPPDMLHVGSDLLAERIGVLRSGRSRRWSSRSRTSPCRLGRRRIRPRVRLLLVVLSLCLPMTKRRSANNCSQCASFAASGGLALAAVFSATDDPCQLDTVR